MIYADAGQQIDEMRDLFQTGKGYRMAVVSSVSSGRPMIRFFGENEASRKKYKYLQSYTPTAGDKVLLARVGNSYVILGKVV